jgi:V/A-type H+-transporting ATPase subunit A
MVVAEGLGRAGLYDVVEVGNSKITGEIIKNDSNGAVIQVYEENTGMQPGESVVSSGMPLSLKLGPGLVGTIFDGIQRPLDLLKAKTGAFIHAGAREEPLRSDAKWLFKPVVKVGDSIQPGGILGRVEETPLVEHKIMVPPNLHIRKVKWIAEEGRYGVNDVVLLGDEGIELTMAQYWPVRVPRPIRRRLAPTEPLLTGRRVIDILFPLSKGGTAAVPGGFGTGKTMVQHAIAKFCDADIIVYIGCGERGNEMTDVLTEFPELIDPRSGRSIMERTILVANTSNMPVAAREVSIYTGITLAEYYRDMGYHVAVMADSTSRWAEALRELSGRLQEMPAEEGFPAYLPTRLAEFYERGGRVETLSGGSASVSIIGAVSPPGGDFSEPVTQHTKRFIRCFWALDRDLANARHYPAISWLDSYSEYVDELLDWWNDRIPEWKELRAAALDLLKREEKLEQIVRLIGPDALSEEQRLVLMSAEIMRNGFLQQDSLHEVDRTSSPEKSIALMKAILLFHKRAEDAIRAGADIGDIASLGLRERLSRLKNEIPDDRHESIVEFQSEMNAVFDELIARRGSGARP